MPDTSLGGALCMIVFLLTPHHGYTHTAVREHAGSLDVHLGAYHAAFATATLPLATYVFCDLDRLALEELRVAAELYRKLREGGARVLNDPARVPSRYGLLRMLHAAGINAFDAWRVEEGRQPTRWPVFLRTEGGHDAPVSGLLDHPEQLEQAIERAAADGVPRAAMLIVEFCAEPVRPGLWRRLSCYRIGDAMVADNCVHDDQWLVKYGKPGIATPELYEDELAIARGNPHGPELAGIFRRCGIEYGRADFGLVGGRVQVYEINTNPNVRFPTEHPVALRLQTYAEVRRNYLAALAEIDTPPGAPIAIDSDLFRPWRARAAAPPPARPVRRWY